MISYNIIVIIIQVLTVKEQEIAQLKVSHSELTQMALEGVTPTQSKVKEEPGLDTDSVSNFNSGGGYQQCLKSPGEI